LTEGEWRIIRAVWAHQPCAAPTVQEALEKETGWSYSTVKTLMDRMVKKGLLETERVRNLILYRSVVSRQQAQRREVLRVVKRAFDGAMTPMMQFLVDQKGVSDAELAEMERLIREKRRGK
jgi:BlaI family penicillinase repressor